jgi:hypothetical protein
MSKVTVEPHTARMTGAFWFILTEDNNGVKLDDTLYYDDYEDAWFEARRRNEEAGHVAITDDQMSDLIDFAEQMGRDGVLASIDPSDQQIIDAVFDFAEISNMRTDDEFDAIITEQDMPAIEDRRDLLSAWQRGHAEYIRAAQREDAKAGRRVLAVGRVIDGKVVITAV